MDKTRKGKPTGRVGKAGRRPGGPGYPLELRVRAVEEVLRHGARHGDVAIAYGVGTTTLSAWIRDYRRMGVEGSSAHLRGHRVIVQECVWGHCRMDVSQRRGSVRNPRSTKSWY